MLESAAWFLLNVVLVGTILIGALTMIVVMVMLIVGIQYFKTKSLIDRDVTMAIARAHRATNLASGNDEFLGIPSELADKLKIEDVLASKGRAE